MKNKSNPTWEQGRVAKITQMHPMDMRYQHAESLLKSTWVTGEREGVFYPFSRETFFYRPEGQDVFEEANIVSITFARIGLEYEYVNPE